jgi:hypothetical protein
MKNIHILPTNKPSTLFRDSSGELKFNKDWVTLHSVKINQHLYITSEERDDEIREGDWVITPTNDLIQWAKVFHPIGKKVILTTNQSLDNVQTINDDEFLEWIIQNPLCEYVDVVKEMYMPQSNGRLSDGIITHEISLNPSDNTFPFYKISIPKQETNKMDNVNLISEIEKLLNMNNPKTRSNWMCWDKGDCSKVGIVRILLIQTIENEIDDRGDWYDGCYDELLDSLFTEYTT